MDVKNEAGLGLANSLGSAGPFKITVLLDLLSQVGKL